jgi:hypothetical protein
MEVVKLGIRIQGTQAVWVWILSNPVLVGATLVSIRLMAVKFLCIFSSNNMKGWFRFYVV